MIRRLLDAIFGEQPDQAWKPTGIRRDQRCYDHAKAVAAQERADDEEERRRKLAAKRSRPATPKKARNVREFKKAIHQRDPSCSTSRPTRRRSRGTDAG